MFGALLRFHACFLTLLVCVFIANPAAAQRSDSFEGGLPRWQLVESDCSRKYSATKSASLCLTVAELPS